MLESSSSSKYIDALPMCMVTLNPSDLRPIHVNEMFTKTIGPLYKFQESDFCLAASEDENGKARKQLREAVEKVTQQPEEAGGVDDRVRIRNVEMITLTDENSGFPIKRFFDWFIRRADDDAGTLVLLGDPCTDQDVTQREKDAELIDFFQNAPIALHWLSGEGKVLWANQTELNVLGYTAKEYMGRPLMQFCPDEEELVLEIFKQLGSGNAIKDVPVRFRTKDGKIVHLLIDSNVKYDKDGSFGHTRCFIRDDTGRKIRESKASLLLEETKRSLAMLDNFMARSLHHMRTPLHVTQNMVDAIASYFEEHKKSLPANEETEECMTMVSMATSQIQQSVRFLDDVADLSKFDQGAVLHMTPAIIDLHGFGMEILQLETPPAQDGVQVVLELCQNDLAAEGPSMAVTDPIVLKRILRHLVTNAVEVTEKGSVTLGIGYKNNRLSFEVTDTGPGLEMPKNAVEGDLPVIFQRYHQELLPEDTPNLTIATTLRDKIEMGINSHKKSNMGIGLSLTYHLVQALGGEIRCTSRMGEGTKFHFSLPRDVSYNRTIPPTPPLPSIQMVRQAVAPKPSPVKKEENGDSALGSTDGESMTVKTDLDGEAMTEKTDLDGEPMTVKTDIDGEPMTVKTEIDGEPMTVKTNLDGDSLESADFAMVPVGGNDVNMNLDGESLISTDLAENAMVMTKTDVSTLSGPTQYTDWYKQQNEAMKAKRGHGTMTRFTNPAPMTVSPPGHSGDDDTDEYDDEHSPSPYKRARGNEIPSSFSMPNDILPDIPASLLAECGVKSQDPPSILVVEDTAACAKMLCRTLARFQCATKWVENGRAAVELLKDEGNTPGAYDLVLMDLRMPIMDGLEATRIIKQELGIAIPVVALTGDDNDQTRAEAEAIGFDAFFGKPMKRESLKEIVKKFTGYEVQ